MGAIQHALVLVVLASFGVAAQERPASHTTPAARPVPEGDAAASAISRLRASSGLGPVKPDPALTRAAQAQARAMAISRTLSHTVVGDLSSRMRAVGLNVGAGAENLAQGQRSLAEAIEGWVNSPAHRRNLLLAEATRIGLARATAGDGTTTYWALILASPDQAPMPTMGGGGKAPLPFGLGTLFGR